ncbi:MAG TPA: methyl-accepting chemotaxis protein [Fibrobacteria bacterium]|nr:methyl-accepting chemotaxis protein [Fibrobacteria bacterium]
MSIRSKMLLTLVLSVLTVIVASSVLVSIRLMALGGRQVEQFRRDAMERQVAAIREQVETALSILKPYADSVDTPERRARAKDVIGRIRFGTSGYMFVYDYEGYCQVLTTKPAWMGTHRIDEKDKLGRPYLKQLIEAAKRGGDTVRYSFDKPGTSAVADKIAYARGFETWKWMLGTGVYIDDIDSMVAMRDREVRASTRGVILGIVGMSVLVLVLVLTATVVVLRRTLAPLSALQERMEEVAQGDADLRRRLEIASDDEVGTVARAFNRFLATLQSTVGQVGAASKTLAATSEELSSMSQGIAGESGFLAGNSREVASLVGKTSTDLGGIAQSAANGTRSMSTLSAAIEEMSASLSEVAKTGQQELECASKARDRAVAAREAMARLDRVIDGVGGILDAIGQIADQTKLLALNATIEAARAGDAGKGFAVVAGEVKLLAQQTAKATMEIQQRIAQMRQGGLDAVEAVPEVEQVIGEVHHLSVVVGGAVEEQSATVKEIARTISQVDREVASIASTVSEASGQLGATSQSIRGLDDGVGRMGSGIVQMDQATRELAKLAAELHGSIGRFKS